MAGVHRTMVPGSARPAPFVQTSGVPNYDALTALHYAGRWKAGAGETVAIVDRFYLLRIASLKLATRSQIDDAVIAARHTMHTGLPRVDRASLLDSLANRMEAMAQAFIEVYQAETGANLVDTMAALNAGLQTLRRTAVRMRHAPETLGIENVAFDRFRQNGRASDAPLLVLPHGGLDRMVAALTPIIASNCVAIVRSSLEAPLTTALFLRLVVERAPRRQFSMLHIDYELTDELITSGDVRTVSAWQFA